MALLTNFRNRVRPEKYDFAKIHRKNATPAEKALWAEIRRKRLGVKFHRQKVILGYIADFWCPSKALVVEVDGASHIGREEYDARRDQAMQRIGIHVIRFSNEAVLESMESVVAQIQMEIHDRK